MTTADVAKWERANEFAEDVGLSLESTGSYFVFYDALRKSNGYVSTVDEALAFVCGYMAGLSFGKYQVKEEKDV